MSAASLRQPEVSRGLLALLFAVFFLFNGGAGLWVSLTAHPAHVNALSAVVSVFGLIALGGAVQQFVRVREKVA